MGAGKTAVGRLLAERRAAAFLDLDHQVEEVAGLSVREIFERDGEARFRALERESLEATRSVDEIVIATGGGTIAQPGARAAMADGLVVWLNPPFATITRRIGALGKAERPLFRDERQAMDLYRLRLDAYRSADLQVDVGSEEEVEETVARIDFLLRRGQQGGGR
jgi:shikimate kinase